MRWFFKNQREEYMQKCAWRFVRSAEDRLGAGKGPEKLAWATDKMKTLFDGEERENLQDYVRAAFANFKAEQKAMNSY